MEVRIQDGPWRNAKKLGHKEDYAIFFNVPEINKNCSMKLRLDETPRMWMELLKNYDSLRTRNHGFIEIYGSTIPPGRNPHDIMLWRPLWAVKEMAVIKFERPALTAQLKFKGFA